MLRVVKDPKKSHCTVVCVSEHQGSILSMLYKQLLQTQILKLSARNNENLSVFFALLGSASVKAACRMLMKLTLGVDFTKLLFAKQKRLQHTAFG